MKISIIPICALVAIAACSSPAKKDPAADVVHSGATTEITMTEDQIKIVNLRIGHAENRNISGVIKANGMLDVPPQNLVTISAPLGGFVKKTDLLQGMKVQKGQVIVTLEHPDYIQIQQDFLDLQSQLEFQQAEYRRQEALASENVNAGKTLQQARATYTSTNAKLQGLIAKLRLINIDTARLRAGTISSSIQLFSPITGYITQVNVNVGMHVSPTDVMFRIIDNTHLHAEAQVYERDITKLRVGQRVRFTLSQDSKERTAKVYLIGKEITPERTVRVHCHLDVEDPTLIPGMYFNAVIETNNESVLALSSDAVVTFEGKDYIFVVKNESTHQFEMTEIVKGRSDDRYVGVTFPEKLAPDTPVVISGAYELLSFLKNKDE